MCMARPVNICARHPVTPALNVIEMAREGLELELRNAIRTAASEGSPTLNREIQVKTDGGFTTVSLSVRRLPATKAAQNLSAGEFSGDSHSNRKPSNNGC